MANKRSKITNENNTKSQMISGIIKGNIFPNRLYLPWLSTIVEEENTKSACDTNNDTSCSGVHRRNIPVEIIATSL